MNALLVALVLYQDPHPGVDQKRVDEAIDKGVEYLLKQRYETWDFLEHGRMRFDDLVLYTLYHAGLDPDHEVFRRLLRNILETPLERTYCVSLQAMFLSEFDAIKYQWRLKQCGQFLVDNQCKNGQWSYGTEVSQDKDEPTGGGGTDVPTGAPAAGLRPPSSKKERKKPDKVIQIARRVKPEKDSGDNSNSQYAALGLRACMEANVFPPAQTLRDAKEWWERCVNNDGGWGYGDKGAEGHGSMTVGAVGCLVIYKHFLKEDWKSDRRVVDGVRWLQKKWTVKANPGLKDGFWWHYYYLYAVERLGILTGLDRFGTIDWYKDGATFLLGAQKEDGAWYEGPTYGGAIKDTCFAILFLRRATVPLPKVATGGKR